MQFVLWRLRRIAASLAITAALGGWSLPLQAEDQGQPQPENEPTAAADVPSPAPQEAADQQNPAPAPTAAVDQPDPGASPITREGYRSVIKHADPSPPGAAPTGGSPPEPAPLGTAPAGPAIEAAQEQPTPAELREADTDNPPTQNPSAASPVELEAARFNGIQPGKSTVAQLTEQWGEPAETAEEAGQPIYVYRLAPFKLVELRAADNVVRSITVHLAEPTPADQLAQRLKLDAIRSAEVVDGDGESLGRAFPERGVMFSYAPGEPKQHAVFILLEPIDAQTFLLRAEAQLDGPYTDNLRDLETACRLNPKLARAHCRRAELYLKVGNVEEAANAIQQALQLEPQRAEYHLTGAQCLVAQTRASEAMEELEAVLSQADLPPLVHAEALMQLGALVSIGPAHDYPAGLGRQMQAIKLAEPLADDASPATARKAMEILIDANLNIARDIGWGRWNHKAEVVPKWIQQAAELADKLPGDAQATAAAHLEVARRAMEAYAGLASAGDPAPVVARAEKAAASLLTEANDPLARQCIRWQLGQMYAYALRIEHGRGTFDQGLHYGELALKNMEEAAAARQTSPRARYELGRLLFSIGALHAVLHQDHEGASAWYVKAAPLLTPLPGHEPVDPRGLGESMVSMGVTYWQIDLRQKAVELTQQGAKLIEQAVAIGSCPRSSLAVPYGNLAAMYEDLGDSQQAESFIQLAEGIQDSMQR